MQAAQGVLEQGDNQDLFPVLFFTSLVLDVLWRVRGHPNRFSSRDVIKLLDDFGPVQKFNIFFTFRMKLQPPSFWIVLSKVSRNPGVKN